MSLSHFAADAERNTLVSKEIINNVVKKIRVSNFEPNSK